MKLQSSSSVTSTKPFSVDPAHWSREFTLALDDPFNEHSREFKERVLDVTALSLTLIAGWKKRMANGLTLQAEKNIWDDIVSKQTKYVADAISGHYKLASAITHSHENNSSAKHDQETMSFNSASPTYPSSLTKRMIEVMRKVCEHSLDDAAMASPAPAEGWTKDDSDDLVELIANDPNELLSSAADYALAGLVKLQKMQEGYDDSDETEKPTVDLTLTPFESAAATLLGRYGLEVLRLLDEDHA
jgi:hypothetical protein